MQSYHTCSKECTFTRRRGSVYACTRGGGLHICGAACTLEPLETVEGGFCPWTGSQIREPQNLQYANYLSKTPYGGRQATVHWATENKRGVRKQKQQGLFLHSQKNICAALRLVFASNTRTALQAQQQAKITAFLKQVVKRSQAQMQFATACKWAKRAAKKWPAVACRKIKQDDDTLERVQRAIQQYIATSAHDGLVIKNTKAFVAALLTLMAEGLAIRGVTFVPKIPWVAENIVPPNFMTAIGIPCRSVSLAVRAVKMYMYGPDENGIKDRAMSV